MLFGCRHQYQFQRNLFTGDLPFFSFSFLSLFIAYFFYRVQTGME